MDRGDPIVAIALLNEPTFVMLQSSLKRVYRIENTHLFDDLIRELDAIDAHRG